MSADILDFMEYYKKKYGTPQNVITNEDVDYLFNHHMKIDEEHLDWLCFNLDIRKYNLFLSYLFQKNHFILSVGMPLAGFIIGYRDEHIPTVEEGICNALDKMERDYCLINAKGKSLIEIAENVTKRYFRNKYEAFDGLIESFDKGNTVYIFSELSSSKVNSGGFIRDLIKFQEILHSRNILSERRKANTDLIFIDYARFLQKVWPEIGYYLCVTSYEGHLILNVLIGK